MELFRALGALSERPGPGTERVAEALGLESCPRLEAYTSLFRLSLPPYASIYLGPEGMLGGEARDRVAGFWRAIGEEPPPEPDHLAVLLAAYAGLAEREAAQTEGPQRDASRRARAAFLWEHLLSWLPPYLDAVTVTGSPVYREWAMVAVAALEQEAGRIPPPAQLPMALRAHPALEEHADADSRDVLASVLAPVRSGILLTAGDLVRAAGELGLGRRAGERRFVLQAFLEQDPARCWRWLSDEASRWAERHEGRQAWLGDVAGEWARRAWVTAALATARAASGVGR